MDNLNQEVHELSMYLTAISMEDSINLAPAVECALSKGIVGSFKAQIYSGQELSWKFVELKIFK